MQKIRKGDTVQVIAGNDIGLRGEVKEIVRDWKINRKRQRVARNHNGDRVFVASINMVRKHQRATNQARQAGIIDMEAPMHMSNVMLVCPSCDEAVRVGIRVLDGEKQRFCKRCDATID